MRSRSERSAFARKVRRARAIVRKYGYGDNPPKDGPTGKEKLVFSRYQRAMAVLMEAALKWGSHYPPQNGSTAKPLPSPQL